MSANRKMALADWIHKQATREGMQIKMFALMHVGQGGQNEIDSVVIGSRQVNATDLADRFDNYAETDAGGVSGTQQYQVLSFFGAEKTARGRYTIQKEGAGGIGENGSLGTEPPNEKGHLAQLMRMTENMYKSSLTHSQALFGMHQQLLSVAVEQNKNLMEENHMAFELIKKYKDDLTDKSHAHTMEALKMERDTDSLRKMLGMIPALANTIAGKDIFPVSAADTSLIDTIADNITEEQIPLLDNLFPPEVAGILKSRLERSLNDKSARKARRQLPTGAAS